MKENKLTKQNAFRWKQFNHKSFSVFNSLKREVNIGVLAVATLAFANTDTVFAQNQSDKDIRTYELEEVEVTGTRVPLTQAESARMVTVLSQPEIQAAAVHSINDLLEYAVGVDVRQRGEFGIQTDISIRGGTFDQITILLNGVNLNNPQTGHLTADFPVSMDDIERIEILEGPAARVFGTSAFTGAINIVTKTDPKTHIAIDAMGGAYGLAGGGLRFNYSKNRFSQQVSGQYKRTDGATTNSDFQTGKVYYQGNFSSNEIDVQWQFGFSDQQYGANTFYSASFPNQYEKTRRYITSVQAQTKGWFKFTPTIYWNRSHDNFQLVKGTPKGENFHRTDVYGANLNAHFTTILGKTAFGTEIRNEGILSTNLGKDLTEDEKVKIPGQKDQYFDKKDNRTNVSYYLEHNILLKSFTLSAGVLANMNTGLDHKYRFYPGIDLSYRPNINWKLFASWNKALRMPTFTDLYYKSPTQQGNQGLQPERTEAYTLGVQFKNEIIHSTFSGFYHKGKQMIDWVMYNSEDIYHSANFELNNRGFETNTQFNIEQWLGKNIGLKSLQLGYSYISQNRKDDTEIYKSNYALSYLRHKLVTQLKHRFIFKKLTVNWALRWQDRMGEYIDYSNTEIKEGVLKSYPSFALIDLKLQWQEPKFNVYIEANNLLDKTYFDLGSVPQPGFWIKGGIKYRIDI